MATNRHHYQQAHLGRFQGLESTMSVKDDQHSSTRSGSNYARDSGSGKELPKLSGPKKLKRWAYQIRAYYQKENPDSILLIKETNVQYWVDNRISLIGDIKLPKSFPKLSGGSDGQLRWAVAIRAKFAETFPESRLMYSQTQAKFWVENRRVFDFAILGYQIAADEVGCADGE